MGRGGGVHQVVDGDAADAAHPGLHVAQANVEVLADAGLGDLARHVHVEQVVLANAHVLAAHKQLVGRGHVLVEDFDGDAGEGRVGDPGAVVAGAHLAQLVGAHAVHGRVVGGLVVLDGNLRRHAAHGVHAALVARLDEQLDVGVHEGHRHGDAAAVGQDEARVLAELFDDGKDVIPAAAVEPGAVVAQLVDDLVHLEGGEDGLDEHSAADGAARQADVVLRQVEGVVPQARLEVRLHLGQVKVGAEAALDGLVGVVEKVEAKVKEGAAHGLAVDRDVLLLEVPAARPHDERGQRAVGPQLVLLGALLEVDLAADGVVQVDLAVDHVFPRGGARVCGVLGGGRDGRQKGHSPSKSAM